MTAHEAWWVQVGAAAAAAVLALGVILASVRLGLWPKALTLQRDEARAALNALQGPAALEELAQTIDDLNEEFSSFQRVRALRVGGGQGSGALSDLPVGSPQDECETVAIYFECWKPKARKLVNAAVGMGIDLDPADNPRITRAANQSDLATVHKTLQRLARRLRRKAIQLREQAADKDPRS